MEGRPKIEIVRVSSIERTSFRPLDGVQLLRARCKYKKPVSRLLKRRHQATCLETKSCDNIYNVKINNTSSDWKISQVSESGVQGCHSNSLDWRVGRTVNNSSDKLNWQDGSGSTEQLSKCDPLTSNLSASSTKSKIVNLLKRLSPRLSRSVNKVSLPSSPTICPWIQVEYASETINSPKRKDFQETDNFQQELQINELKKKMIGVSPTKRNSVPTKNVIKTQILVHPTKAPERNRAPCTFRP